MKITKSAQKLRIYSRKLFHFEKDSFFINPVIETMILFPIALSGGIAIGSLLDYYIFKPPLCTKSRPTITSHEISSNNYFLGTISYS